MKEHIDIDEYLADEIKYIEYELLKRHGITKQQSIMFKNSPKIKAYKAEWLEYIENVEDSEGDAMQLQYIYEVFRIDVLNEHAFDVFINAHYPSEIDSFNQFENEELYHRKLLDYVVENAQRKHDNHLKKKHDKEIKPEDLKAVYEGLGFSEDEALEYVEQLEEDTYENGKELSPYMALLEGDRYVDCIRNLHTQLHGMSATDIEEIKMKQHMIDKQMKEELAQLGLSYPAEAEPVKSVKNGVRNYDNSSKNAIKQQEEQKKKELLKQQEVNQAAKEAVLENREQQDNIFIDDPIADPSMHYSGKENKYHTAMADVEDEVRVYKEKYGDKGMEHMKLDAVLQGAGKGSYSKRFVK